MHKHDLNQASDALSSVTGHQLAGYLLMSVILSIMEISSDDSKNEGILHIFQHHHPLLLSYLMPQVPECELISLWL